MSIITQKVSHRQAVVKFAIKNGKSKASIKYRVSLSSVKRWCKRYDGTPKSLEERSRRPKSHPRQHTPEEEALIRESFKSEFSRYGWDGVYDSACKKGYKRSFKGMVYAARRMGLGRELKNKKPPRKSDRRFPELLTPGEKVQVDIKYVPYNCMKGEAKLYGRRFYQWTAIDECTRYRYVYCFEEKTPENSVRFLEMLKKAFPFRIQTIQTDNGTEFTNKFVSENTFGSFENALINEGIIHKLIPVRTPWHNGKVERSHRNDQRYFYDWEKFGSLEELNKKLSKHLEWSNGKTMRTLGRKSPIQLLEEKLAAQ